MSSFRLRLSALALSLLALAGGASAAGTSCIQSCAAPLPLQLEVYRNGGPTGLIAAFTRQPDGRFTTAAAELRALGLTAPQASGPVALDALPGVSFRFDDAQQRMFIDAQPSAIAPQRISMRDGGRLGAPSRDAGGVVNYSLSAGVGRDADGVLRGQGLSAAAEARVFGAFGMASTAVVSTIVEHRARSVRLDTSWILGRPRDATAFRAGDTISGGSSWTRPVRMAGLQWRRDFATRPDLVTAPTVALSASAAAPSTLEVMLGSTVVMSRKVSEGPIQVTDLPVVRGRGEARLVLRDAAGVTESVVASYFAAPDLLARGLADFSMEAGFTRRSFGYESNDYDPRPVASASARYGWTDAVTLQAHAEGGAGLANASLGASALLGDFGVGSLAAAQSWRRGESGALLAAAFETSSRTVVLSAQAQRTFGRYRDLAAVTAETEPYLSMAAALPPKSLLQVALSAPVRLAVLERFVDAPTISVSYGQTRSVGSRRRSLLSAAVRFFTGRRISVQAAAYAAASGRREHGLFIGVTTPLGRDLSGSGGVDSSAGRVAAYAEVRRDERPESDAVAWRVRADQGAQTRVEGEAIYRSPIARVAMRAAYQGGATRIEGRADGGLVWMGGPMLARERVDSAFAVVEVGAPGVDVLKDNRRIGKSGRGGRLLVLNLDAYSVNTLAIDETQVPLEFNAGRTRVAVSPPYGAGTWVRFGVARAPMQALVGLRLPNGETAPVGALASLNGGADDIVIGYDGLAFVVSPKLQNTLRLDLGDGRACTVTFNLNAAAKGIARVPDAICT